MTKEELNKLKKGDEVFVKTVFDGLAKNGDAYVRFFWTNWKGKRVPGTMSVTSDAIFLRLELVTPVDELEPFYIDQIQSEENRYRYCFAIKTREHEHLLRLFYTSDLETMEQTKAAAEEECARLNAEYRKEQK